MTTDDQFLEKQDVSGEQFLRNETSHALSLIRSSWGLRPRVAGNEAECRRWL